MKREQGFSLLELMVIIGILSILAGIAVPGIARWYPNYRLMGAARDLYSNLQLAKSGAIKDRAEWAVRFTSASSYEVWSARDPDSPDQNTGWNSFSTSDDTLIKTVSLADIGSGVAFGAAGSTPVSGAVAAGSGNPIYFNSRGFTTYSAPIYAYMTNNRNTCYAVGAMPSGAVVLKKWNGTSFQ
jgi:prepilin-type N-terminal cleavage/methylation domain-containing protein